VNDPSERRVAEEYMRREGRLPPGQSLTNGFPVGQYGPIPAFDPLTWDFRLFGELEEERHWNWPAFNALPRTQIRLDIHCVTRWSKFDTLWEGVSPRQILDLGIIKLKPSARFVVQHCEGGFTTNLPLEVVLAPNFLLATHFDGQPLEPGHGYPLRAVVGSIPGAVYKTPYFWKGGKWLRALEFTPDDQPGFWERGGYHNDGDVWLEQRHAIRPRAE
jgi:DMSO/TMAO reductase YedYZ molybdopterin-dependent catalytic subunit